MLSPAEVGSHPAAFILVEKGALERLDITHSRKQLEERRCVFTLPSELQGLVMARCPRSMANARKHTRFPALQAFDIQF